MGWGRGLVRGLVVSRSSVCPPQFLPSPPTKALNWGWKQPFLHQRRPGAGRPPGILTHWAALQVARLAAGSWEVSLALPEFWHLHGFTFHKDSCLVFLF